MRVVFRTNPYKYQSETDGKTIVKHEIYPPPSPMWTLSPEQLSTWKITADIWVLHILLV